MTNLVYWMLFAVAVIVWVAVPICARLERNADERDKAAWRRMGGGRL